MNQYTDIRVDITRICIIHFVLYICNIQNTNWRRDEKVNIRDLTFF